MMKRICCILNYGPHYRDALFRKMDSELKCDFYFGDNVFFDLKKMDFSKLQGYKGELKTLRYKSLTWHLGISMFIFKKYDCFIITADPRCLSYWLLVLICKIRNKDIYMWGHGLKLPYPSKRAAILTKTFLRNASGGLLLYGNSARDLMIEEGFPESKLYVIYNSLDHEKQLKLRKRQKITAIYKSRFQNTDPVIIFIGRLIKEKRLELIIEAQKKLSDAGVVFNTVLVGEGEMNESLKSFAIKQKLANRIWFYGTCYEEEQIAGLIYNATLTVSPGDTGLTIIHSLVYGTPIITHSNYRKHGPEYEAISLGETGDFFEENDVDQLVDKIDKWIKLMNTDRDKIRVMCCKKVDSFYNPQFQVELLKKILK